MTNEQRPDTTYAMARAEHGMELARLQKLEGLRDPHTFRSIDLIGVSEGWRCVDVGAGAGSVARHFAGMAGPSGHVVAADMDPRFLDDFPGPGRSVLAHDIGDGPIPPADFDLAHTRAVLTHVADPVIAVRNLVASLRTGGWLLCEEPDYVSMEPCDPEHEYASDLETYRRIMTESGRQDGYIGRKLHNLFAENGLIDVQAEGQTALVTGSSLGAQFRINGLQNARPLLLASGWFDDAAVDRLIAMFDDPTFAYLELTWMATRGRKP